MSIRQLKLVNGLDILASVEQANSAAPDTLHIDGLILGPVVRLTKPRIIMMQQSHQGIQVGLIPFSMDDEDVATVEMLRTAIVAIITLPANSRLLTSYLETTSGIALARPNANFSISR